MNRRLPRATAPLVFVVSASACAQPGVADAGPRPAAKHAPVVVERDAGWPAPAETETTNCTHNHAAGGAFCFGEPTFYPTSAGLIRAADMNGDGWPDIVSFAFPTDIVVFFNTADGTGALLPPSAPLHIGLLLETLEVGDLDGDGDIDIAATSQLGNALTIILNDGEGRLSLDRRVPFARPRSVEIGNIDRDPEEELFVQDGAGVTLLDRTPAGGFLRVETFPRGSATLGDLDNDGDRDLVLSISSFITVEPLTRLYLNDGGGGFTLWQTLPTFTTDAAVVDFTGNGLPDIV
ncbi:MAG: VCBS repeat-containing protein, partial [Planctomycetota bacterium]